MMLFHSVKLFFLEMLYSAIGVVIGMFLVYLLEKDIAYWMLMLIPFFAAIHASLLKPVTLKVNKNELINCLDDFILCASRLGYKSKNQESILVMNFSPKNTWYPNFSVNEIKLCNISDECSLITMPSIISGGIIKFLMNKKIEILEKY